MIISSTSSASQKQREQQKSNALKIAKKIKFNAVKNAKRIKSKALKTEETAKSTSTFQDIDIFDSILTCENRQFNELAKFLQHFQQCQHLYRESDLLMLLLTCFWSSVFDIWYDKQSIMNSTSLCEWIEILRIDFAVAFTKSKVNCSKITCIRCDSNFNFKEKFRKHVREQHAKKHINSSSLSINTLKSECEDEKKSTFDDSSVSSISQESEIFIATSKQIFESTMIFETITSSKISHLSFSASEIVFESMKNTSTQCLFTSSKLSSSKTFESEHQEISVWKSSEFCSSLSIDTVKSICEIEKRSTIIETLVLQAQHISFAISRSQIAFEITSSKSSNLSTETFKVVSKSTKNESNQCFFVSMFSFSSTFESKHHEFVIQKFESENSLFKIFSDKLICETMKKSTVTNLSASTILLSIFKRSCFICRIDVSSVEEHYFESSSCHETLRHRLKQQFARRAHQREQKAQKQTEVEKAINHSVSSICSNFSIATLMITSKRVKSASIQQIAYVRICKRCKQSFNFNNKFHEHLREHHARKFVISRNSDLRVFASKFLRKIIEKSAVSCSLISQFASFIFFATSTQILWRTRIFNSISSNRSNFSLATYKIASELTKSVSIICSITFSFSSFRTFVRKHHEFHMQKSYLIMNDLSRMFDKKFKSFDLQQHQNRVLSSRNFDIRQFHSIKSHLIIENLFEMFNEKFKKKSLFQNQRNVFSREFFSKQSQIIVYFKSAINKKSSINQISKSSKIKSLKQLISAKSICIVFTNCFEKSIISSYKMFDILCSNSMINYFKNEIFEISYVRESSSRQFRSFSQFSRFSSQNLHVCRICFDQIDFDNDLHKHSRTSLKSHSSCQFMKAIK